MAGMATYATNRGLFLLAKGDLDFDTADLRCALLTTEVAEATGKDVNFLSEVTGNEVAVSGYSRQTLASVSITEDDTNNRVNIDFGNVTFTGLATGATINHAVIYVHNAADAAAAVVAFVDSANFPLPTNGSDVTLTIADLFRISSTAV